MDETDPMRVLNMAAGGRVNKDAGGLIAKALGIDSKDLEWAKSQDKRYDKKEAYDGKGDAARHLVLGFSTQRADNPKAALTASNLREYVTLDTVGRPMDIHNNNLGATINAKSLKEAEKEIDRLIQQGEAEYMTPSESYQKRSYAKGGKVLNTLKRNCSK